MGTERAFRDRRDAGEQLGRFLERKYRGQDLLVLAVPRGGVEVGHYVALALGAELSVAVSKKLPFPGNDEVGFGAASEEGEIYVSSIGRKTVPADAIENIIARQLGEVGRRVQLYRGKLPLPEMEGRTVIIVDDGIATGATLVPVIRLCRKKGASKVIVAAPVSSAGFDRHLYEADAVETLLRPMDFYGVGQFYRRFGDLGDDEVLALLKPPVI